MIDILAGLKKRPPAHIETKTEETAKQAEQMEKAIPETKKTNTDKSLDLTKLNTFFKADKTKPAAPVMPEPSPTSIYNYPDQPAEFPEEQTAFRAQLQTLIASFDTPELADNVLYVMEYIKSHKETTKFLLPEDIGLLVTSCQKAYEIIAFKKAAKKKTKTKITARDSEIADLMSDIGL